MIVSGSNSYSARKKRRLDVNVIQATEFLSCLTATSRKFLRSISQYAGIMLDALTKAYVATSCQHNLSDRHNLSESGRSFCNAALSKADWKHIQNRISCDPKINNRGMRCLGKNSSY